METIKILMVLIVRNNLINILFLIVISIILIFPDYTLAATEPSSVKYIEGKWVLDNGYVIEPSMIPYPGLVSKYKPPDFIMIPYNQYLEYRKKGIINLDADVYHVKNRDTGETWVFALIEPNIIKKSINVYGELYPGEGDVYGPYGSSVAIHVEVDWGPTDQKLGIVLLEVETGEAYGYWFSGGHAEVQFSVDWTNSYYILILSKNTNTQVIFYTGTIDLYMW